MIVKYREIIYLPAICYAKAFYEAYPDNFIFLDSNSDNRNFGEEGRYSYVCFNPTSLIHVSKQQCFHDEKEILGNPFYYIKSYLDTLPKYTSATDLPPFQCGLAGYFGYEMLHYLEEVPRAKDDCIPNHTIDDMRLCFYKTMLSFDHVKKKAWLLVSEDFDLKEVQTKLSCLLSNAQKYAEGMPASIINAPIDILNKDFDQIQYEAIIQKTIDYIYEGDIFQANITRRFHAEMSNQINPFDLYQRLRSINPAPFSCFYSWEKVQDYFSALLSSSPERFISVSDKRKVQTRPIKGTRKRHEDLLLDQEIQNELRCSVKDKAENMMIVDLMRNDLSRVCKPFTVKTPHVCSLETFETLHHLVSVIEGELEDDKNGMDVIIATFPGGSITGAPKVRAMQIISELEACPRGPYCGSAGFISLNGAMDTSIMIRTLVLDHNVISFNVGGGIVTDSSPRDEFEETITKANALYKALTAKNCSC
ncbi:MAG: aminodeoxychorismate synthase, component I [Candidatus Puniceispirillum sp.]|nr:aminodeoxychorismate synthase, component I [Candidatus Pelagibacter sp.]MBA4283368.1 aminodeoxychorismate synthase, component I [Candidatus Puniceispirillum sp.]